ncbi:IS21 family transposase [Pirellulaceae bacterium SH501]
MDKSLAIKQLRQQGLSQRAIAITLGVSRGAVIRHLADLASDDAKAPTGSESPNSTKAPTGSDTSSASSPTSRSKCEPFREVILEMLERGLDSQRIFQDLQSEHGYAGKYWSVHRFVRSLGKDQPLPFRRMEVEAGYELQVDFGAGKPCKDHTGAMRKTYIFRAVLSHSRKGYTEAITRLTTENFIRCLENAFWKLGGVPKTVVFDNAKCAVLKADWYDPILHPKILEFCKHYDFAFLPTRPATPRHKGKVERGVDYVQENALKGKTFDTLKQQNEHLEHWEKTVADTRIHGTTKKQVSQAFEAEKPFLGTLRPDRFPFYNEEKRRVTRDGHVAVQGAFYSVDPEYLGYDVWVRWNSQVVRILNHRMEQIALHCTLDRGRFSTHAEHIDPRKTHGIERGVEYLLKKVRFLGVCATRWAESAIAERGVMGSRTIQGLLSLCQKYEASQIDRACDVAWRSQAFSYRVIKNLLEKEAQAVQATMEFMEEHPMIRPMSEYGGFVKQSIQGRSQQ